MRRAASAAFCGTALTALPRLHSQPARLHVSRKGQFAKRIRPTNLLFGDQPLNAFPLVKPNTHTCTPRQVITASAMVLPTLTSLASTGAGIFLLGFIIFIHESGHFLAARWQNIRVKNFSIGFGPKLVSFTPKESETEFTMRMLPLGGYVAFPEHTNITEEGEIEIDEDPDLLQNRPVMDRALVISAGVIANVILAWASIFASVSFVGLPSYVAQEGVNIAAVVDKAGPAALAGFQEGDIIRSVNGREVPKSLQSAAGVAEQIRTSNGNWMEFSVERNSERLSVRVRPRCCAADGSSAMGVQLVPNAIIQRIKPQRPVQAIQTTNSEFWRLSRQTWMGLTSLVGNVRSGSQQLSGPVGVVSMGAELARNDTGALLMFCAVISINLALINSLPLPALDGGQMTFLMIEALRGSPLPMRLQDTINRTALLLFLAFSGVLFFGDLEKLNIAGAIQQLFG